MTPETKNMIAAMSLSLAILIGWQVYFVEPELEADRAAYEARQQVQNDSVKCPAAKFQRDRGCCQPVADKRVQARVWILPRRWFQALSLLWARVSMTLS